MSTPSSGSTVTSAVLRADGVSFSYAGTTVLTGIDLQVDPGHRLGLVGENGSGKSTLLRLLAGELVPDVGAISRPADLGVLTQEFPYSGHTSVAAVIEHAQSAVRAVETELDDAATALATGAPGADRRYELALAAAEAADVWDADVRAARLLAGLGLAEVMGDPGRTVATLSGGQRTRLHLAALLIRRPSALLLDEPTNHLDDDAADLLASELAKVSGAVVLASHDRAFLDAVATEIADLDPAPGPHGEAGGLVVRGGTFTAYLASRAAERIRWEERYEAEQAELKDLQRSIAVTARDVAHDRGPRDNDKFITQFKGARVEKTVSRRVRDAQGRLAELQARQVRKPRPPLAFTPPRPTRGGGGLLAWARDAVVPGRLDMVAAGLPALEVSAGTRLLLTGPNGSGKSTLLHAFAGDLEVASGQVGRMGGVRIGLLEQDLALAGEQRSARELLTLVQHGAAVPDGDARVEAFGLLAPRDLGRRVGELSVGTRRRVVLAMLLAQQPDVLLLDEPTNHLSLTLADELVAAMGDWGGAVVIASHDRWLREHWDGEAVELRPVA